MLVKILRGVAAPLGVLAAGLCGLVWAFVHRGEYDPDPPGGFVVAALSISIGSSGLAYLIARLTLGKPPPLDMDRTDPR